MLGLLHSSIAKFRCKHDLSDRDELLEQFNVDLDDIEIEILALRMVSEWLEPQLNSVLLTKQFMGGKDEKLRQQEIVVHSSLHLETLQCMLLNCWNTLIAL